MTLLPIDAKKFVEELWFVYFKTRSFHTLMDSFLNRTTDDFVLIGTGADEFRIGLQATKEAIGMEMNHNEDLYFSIADEWYGVQQVAESVCVVYGGFALKEKSLDKRNLFADVDCRFTVVCVMKEQGICFSHVHMSVPNIFQTGGEFFPKFLNDRANEILQEEINKKTAELDKLNQEFIEQEELYRIAISASDDVILVVNAHDKSMDYDRDKIEQIYEIPAGTLEKDGFFKTVYYRIHPDDKVRFAQIFKVNSKNVTPDEWLNSLKEPINLEYRIKHKKFGYMWICNTIIPTHNRRGQIMKVVFHVKNINEQKRREQELHGIAIRDGLTNLFNKSYTEQLINSVLKNPKNGGALFMIDIDNFKGVNDSVGHLFADDILKAFAVILSSVFRSDDIVGRFGGDEFIVYMKFSGDAETIDKRSEEIMRRFDSYIESLGDVPFTTSCSIGVAVFPTHGTSFCELYKNADEAMYASKAAGKHKLTVYELK